MAPHAHTPARLPMHAPAHAPGRRGTLDFDHTKYGLIVEKQAALDEVWLACVHVLFFCIALARERG